MIIQVVQGHGELCVSSQNLMPTCTTTKENVTVNAGDLVNFAATPATGFAWDHYDGIGSEQEQNFNIAITQDASIEVYFTSVGNVHISAVGSPLIL